MEKYSAGKKKSCIELSAREALSSSVYFQVDFEKEIDEHTC